MKGEEAGGMKMITEKNETKERKIESMKEHEIVDEEEAHEEKKDVWGKGNLILTWE